MCFYASGKNAKWTQKSILFCAYCFQTTSSFEGHWLSQKDLIALGCVINMMQLHGACLVISSSRGSSLSFPDSPFITPWSHSGCFVLIFWVKCILEDIDLVNLRFLLSKKKEISPLIFTWAAQVVTLHCDCVVGITLKLHCMPGTLIYESLSSSLMRRKVEIEIKVN